MSEIILAEMGCAGPEAGSVSNSEGLKSGIARAAFHPGSP